MPADDLVLNARQIAGYSPVSQAQPADAILIQRGGLGGPYASISPSAFVGTALSTGGDFSVAGQISAQSIQGGAAQFSNLATQLFSAQTATIRNLNASWGAIAGVPIATSCDIDAVLAKTVWSVNGRRGDVTLSWLDVPGAAPIFSPRFFGTPCAETPAPWSNSSRLATTAFVHRAIVQYLDNFIADHPFVFSFNGRTGDILLTAADITAANPPYAPIDSPQFTGLPSAPTAAVGTSTGQLATTAFVMNAITESTTGVSSFNTRTGAVVLQGADITAAGGALLASPTFSGNPQAPTASLGTNTNQIATTAFVMAELAGVITGVTSFNGRTGSVVLTLGDVTGVGGAPLVSPAFSSVPTAPTAAPGTNTVQLATTAFVVANSVSTFNGRTGAVTLSANDISAAGGLVNPSVALTGVPTAPTATAGNSSTQIATTAFVMAAISGATAGVTSFNTRTGAVTLNSTDIAGAGGALLAGPTFTGVPSAPTATTGTNTTQLATTAFVQNAVSAASAGVISFNNRTGAVTLQANDVSAVGGLINPNAALTGVPTAPTAAPATHTTQIATTAFVAAALNGYLPLIGGTLSGVLQSNASIITSVNFGVGSILINTNGMSYNAGTAVAFAYQTIGDVPAMTTYDNGARAGYAVLSASLGAYTELINLALNGDALSMLAFYGNSNTYAVWNVALGSARSLKRGLKLAAKDALQAIARVPIYECDMTQPLPGAQSQHWDWSVIADELEREIPLAVVPPPTEGGYETIRELPIVVALMRAVQQLLTRVETLEARLT